MLQQWIRDTSCITNSEGVNNISLDQRAHTKILCRASVPRIEHQKYKYPSFEVKYTIAFAHHKSYQHPLSNPRKPNRCWRHIIFYWTAHLLTHHIWIICSSAQSWHSRSQITPHIHSLQFNFTFLQPVSAISISLYFHSIQIHLFFLQDY